MVKWVRRQRLGHDGEHMVVDLRGEPGAFAVGAVMVMDAAALRERLWAYPIDGGPWSKGLLQRLMRETGWSRVRAQRGIEEYRRFLFVAMVGGHAVTPSEAVDEVWHTHLMFTRSYWDMCNTLLRRAFHHVPATEEAGEEETLAEQYRQTLVTYRRIFGEPEWEFWGPAETRGGWGRRVVAWWRGRREHAGRGAAMAAGHMAGCGGGGAAGCGGG